MTCKKFETWLVSRNAHFDDNMPSTETDHLKNCPQCLKTLHTDSRLELIIQERLAPKDLPDGLSDRIDQAIDQANNSGSVSFREKALKTAAVAAGMILIVAACYMHFFKGPTRIGNLQQLGEKAAAKHLEKNLHMTFLASDVDQAIAQISKELKFNVIIPDFSGKGFILIGGRICTVDDCKSAYLFYKTPDKIASLFILDYDQFDITMADGSRFKNEIKGLKTDIWKNNSQVYAMVY